MSTLATPRRGRRLAALLGSLAAGAITVWMVLGWVERSAYQSALNEIEQRRYRDARDTLRGLVARNPGLDRGRAAFELGLCEERLGNSAGALEAWKRVPSNSEFGPRASLAQARKVLQGHRFAQAEPLLRAALNEPREAGLEAAQTLAHILKLQGRWDEVIALQEATLGRVADKLPILKELWRLKVEAYPATEFAAALAAAAKAAPNDDRVKLGLAQLAIHTGDLERADTLLIECEQRRPYDAAVIRTALDWAVAADLGALAAATLVSARAEGFSDDSLVRLCAWIEGKLGNFTEERRLLGLLDDGGKRNAHDLERITELALRTGDQAEYQRWRGRKAEYDAAISRYQGLLKGPNPKSSASELAALAHTLGWPVEASYWNLEAASRLTSQESYAAQAHLDASARLGNLAKSELYGRRHGLVPQSPSTLRASYRRKLPGAARVPQFAEVASDRGLNFAFDAGHSARKQLPETMSGGVALIDADGDGWLDVYLMQGGRFPPEPAMPNADRLFRNRGNGSFEDISIQSGITSCSGGYGFGAAVGDVNNDGRSDLFVTRWRSYALYLNQGGGAFIDATAAWKLAGDRDWPTSAAFADLDNDGDLDLYVCHYVRWDENDPPACFTSDGKRAVYCPPATLPGMPDHLFRNDGTHFTDVTAEALIDDGATRGLGVLAADLNGDRLVDLFVANDMNRNLFFRNLGGMRFREEAELVGLASNADGGYLAGMGVALGDIDRDGLPDLAVTNFYGESTRLYRSLGQGQFADESAASGVAGPTRYLLGFGLSLDDMNNDGYLDMLSANGHVDDLRPTVPYTMPAHLLLGSEGGRFQRPAGGKPGVLDVERLGRGLAVGDLDNDGRLDAIVVDQEGPIALFANRGVGGARSSFVTLKLRGAGSAADAVGAEVELECAHARQLRWRVGGGSYLSASDQRVHFGLGCGCTRARVSVRWSSGSKSIQTDLPLNHGYDVKEGAEGWDLLPGFAARNGRVESD